MPYGRPMQIEFLQADFLLDEAARQICWVLDNPNLMVSGGVIDLTGGLSHPRLTFLDAVKLLTPHKDEKELSLLMSGSFHQLEIFLRAEWARRF